MRFKITLNMPAKSGSLVHQILCEHDSPSMEALTDLLETRDFLTVEQFYLKRDANDASVLVSEGQVAIHRQVIGKIEVLRDRM